MAYVSIIERQHIPAEQVPGQTRWRPARVEWVYIRTETATVKNLERIRADRIERLAKGDDVLMVTSLLKPGDRRLGVNRRARRLNEKLARRLLPKLRAQLKRDQARVDKVLDEEFAKGRKKKRKAASAEERTEGGVILPTGVKAPRKPRKRAQATKAR